MRPHVKSERGQKDSCHKPGWTHTAVRKCQESRLGRFYRLKHWLNAAIIVYWKINSQEQHNDQNENILGNGRPGRSVNS